jgi:hypothetical protein
MPSEPVSLDPADARVATLAECEPVSFSAWPDVRVPRTAAGVYTVWRGEHFMYVGMAGRGLNAAGIQVHTANGVRKGLADRLNSHASGRRSGDQFCVYVADRLVLPTLTPDDIRRIAAGELSLDAKVREYIRAEFQFRFAVTRDGREAAELERAIRGGALAAGKPFLNPL